MTIEHNDDNTSLVAYNLLTRTKPSFHNIEHWEYTGDYKIYQVAMYDVILKSSANGFKYAIMNNITGKECIPQVTYKTEGEAIKQAWNSLLRTIASEYGEVPSKEHDILFL